MSSAHISSQVASVDTSSLPERSQEYFAAALRELFDAELFDDTSDGVLVVNDAGHRVYSNAALNSLIGADACLPLGSSAPPSYVPLDQREKFGRIIDGMSYFLADGSGTASTSLELFTVSRGRVRARVTISAFAHPQRGRFTVWLLKLEPASPPAPAGTRPRRGVTETSSQTLLAKSDGSMPPRTEDLTKREKDVLALLLDGRRVSSIARSLYLSEHTVRNHLKAIFRKLGAHSQAELLDLYRPVDRAPTKR